MGAGLETVGYEVTACALDDFGCDWPASVEGLVVAQELALVSQVADARVGSGAAAAFQPDQPEIRQSSRSEVPSDELHPNR
jgi:hypothetical protein